jgi:hypothetical protein
LTRTTSEKTGREHRESHRRGRDDLARLLDIQQESIRRTARWWIDAGLRFQRGDLSMQSWLEAEADYFKKSFESLKEAAELLPLRKRNDDAEGGETE